MEKSSVLVLGSDGMLGQELALVFREDEGYDVIAWDIGDIDLTDFETAEKRIREVSPALIVNAVAYNAVDACEEDEEEYRKATTLNAEVPGFLARLAKDMDVTFIHYSTDYVFDGERVDGYAEDAEPRPISKYGTSKLAGEKAVMEAFIISSEVGTQKKESWIPGQARDDSIGNSDARRSGYYIIRLSKLFGEPARSSGGKKSFFEKILESSHGKDSVDVVDDERSCFTYAPDLAEGTKSLLEDRAAPGIYHLVNEHPATWYEAATRFFNDSGVGVDVVPVQGSAFPRPARRPHQSALLNTKRPKLRGYEEALLEFSESLLPHNSDHTS